ncbi:hypothetical protein Pmani_028216 [Petrolisthes manimaculis]|uniref:Uncharacterized protein n=1 Tax=Petrolisthes manimaculis TaxID=1843537 RepID=A0AAE1TVP9_9EUCA|nr:hypothetical protein Pmani_028216 [Petrolisthes manimaculis]
MPFDKRKLPRRIRGSLDKNNIANSVSSARKLWAEQERQKAREWREKQRGREIEQQRGSRTTVGVNTLRLGRSTERQQQYQANNGPTEELYLEETRTSRQTEPEVDDYRSEQEYEDEEGAYQRRL